MNPQEPAIPDPTPPGQPDGPVTDPAPPDQPAEYQAGAGTADEADDEGLDDYDKSVADSFPASDPPAASEPGS